MQQERRQRSEIRESDREALGSDAQSHMVKALERGGWTLCFIRRPLFQPVMAVLTNDGGQHYAGVDQGGRIVEGSDLDLREQQVAHDERSNTWYSGRAGGSSIPF